MKICLIKVIIQRLYLKEYLFHSTKSIGRLWETELPLLFYNYNKLLVKQFTFEFNNFFKPNIVK